MAVFLVLAGATGSILAFYGNLDAALNPELFRVVPPSDAAPLLDALELHERVRQQAPPGRDVGGAILDLTPNKSVNYWIDERETFFDPYTGRLLGSRKFGDITEGKKNLLTFVYRFHYSLALGDVGTWIFGVVAVLWTMDCFVGAYLTFPSRTARKRPKPTRWWLARWLPSWLIKTRNLFSLVFTWHRASGLWLWGLSLVFAWSGVALNLGDQVYSPVMNLLAGKAPDPETPLLGQPRPTPKLDLRAARDRGRTLMAVEAGRRGFTVIGERGLGYDAKRGAYRYLVESTLDVDKRLPETAVVFDGDLGTPLAFHASTGQTVRGTVDTWLIALHFGAVRELGVGYRAFVAVFGVSVVLLSVTGIWIWWRKTSKRRRQKGLTERTPRQADEAVALPDG